MLIRQRFVKLALCLIACALSISVNADDKSKDKKEGHGTPVLWQQPGDISSRDLLLGPGGEEMKPDLSKVTFIREEKGGYSTKYRVRDGAGREWVVKVGKEAQPETAATRLVWAVGYVTEVTYLVPTVTIEGKGTFQNARFEARPAHAKRLTEWKWTDNPFLGSRELQGLKIMMVLLDNWDLKDSNNKIVMVRDEQSGENQLRYIVSDLGATLGKTGWLATRSRNEPSDFANAKFVDDVKGNFIDLHYSGKRKELVHGITLAHARWIGDLLSRLSDQQIGDAFRSANYSPEDVQLLTSAVRGRINALIGLPQPRGVDTGNF